MEWTEYLNSAVNYIEENLNGEIDYGLAARTACCSTYHFQRMFGYMAGVPLSEYIRRRRMSLAAVDLQNSQEKIVDIALRYGYSSPTAFNRAFQSVHGISPSAARKQGAPVKSYPPVSFKLIVKGMGEMNYHIVEKEAFRIVGISQPMRSEIEENFAVVPEMWGKAAMDGTLPKLAALMDGFPKGLLGVSVCNDKEEWTYFIAVASTQPSEEFQEYQVPACTWAVFPGSGNNLSIQELEQRIVTEWLPASGYEYANAPDIEVYLNPDPANAQYEVWIPVVKKEQTISGK